MSNQGLVMIALCGLLMFQRNYSVGVVSYFTFCLKWLNGCTNSSETWKSKRVGNPHGFDCPLHNEPAVMLHQAVHDGWMAL